MAASRHDPGASSPVHRRPSAQFGPWRATDLAEVVDLGAHPYRLDEGGWWAVVGTFEGNLIGYRFATVEHVDQALSAEDAAAAGWVGPAIDSWVSSMTQERYEAGVRAIADYIAAGQVYQVNLCRMLTAPLTAGDPYAMARVLAAGNPAPYSGVLDLGFDAGGHPEWIVSASPELFLARDGNRLVSSPIKGTAGPGEPFADKDFPENVMICDLVRNDLGRVGVTGTVQVTELLARQEHPGLAHLVSTVQADLLPGAGWAEILAATYPPGSVSGAPKIRALHVIQELEPVPRGAYCGMFGFVDADRRQARLAVGIRTFSASGGTLSFGTGAGITWGSTPTAEWQETQLKANRLIALAST